MQTLLFMDTCYCCAVPKSHPNLQPCRLQHVRLLCPSLSPIVCSDWCPELVMLSNHLILSFRLLLLPSIFPIIRVFSSESAFHIKWPKDWSFSFSISPSNEYSGMISFRIDGLISLQSRNSQESSPAPQFESINSSAFSLLYGSTLLSVHDYWKNHSFDNMDLCWQSDVSAF